MQLKDLLAGVEVLSYLAGSYIEITGVACDSRQVQPGDLFVAVEGFASNGNSYIPAALQKGAVAVVSQRPAQGNMPYVQVASDRKALARIAANFYGHPAKSLTLIGVTGTNGKTSTTLLLKQLLEKATGKKVGLLGTMENYIGSTPLPAERTTPESLELQGLLAKMRDGGCTYGIMEVSSHAIALERIQGLHFAVCAFTNLTQDHLDFHGTMLAYGKEKAKLFGRCDKAVINLDDEWAGCMIEAAAAPVLTLSCKRPALLTAEAVTLTAQGVMFTAVFGGEKAKVQLPIPGSFTVYNALTALGIALQLGLDLHTSCYALSGAKGVKGRAEIVPTPGRPYTVIIDYAHTPDGLYNILTAAKGFATGRVIVVFGCGGNRDRAKRPLMGKIAADLADIAIVTSDNPRWEDPCAIVQDILKGADKEKNTCIVLENRVQAIQYAMDIGQKNDIIILAGKGHETYQELRGSRIEMDERLIVGAYLEETEKYYG